MVKTSDKEIKRVNRHKRIRKKIAGTTSIPRLFVHRSSNNFYAQLINDETGKVLFGFSTMSKDVKSKAQKGGNITSATILGEFFAAEAKKKGFGKVCFDRGGYLYHGRVKAFAEAAREGGMEF